MIREQDVPYTPYQILKAQILDKSLRLLNGLEKAESQGGHVIRIDCKWDGGESIYHYGLSNLMEGVSKIAESAIIDLTYDVIVDPVTRVRIRKVNELGKELAEDIVRQHKP